MAIARASQSLIECINTDICPWMLQAEVDTPENVGPVDVTGREYSTGEMAQMQLSNLILGIIWFMQAYFPITMWYAWRRPSIKAMNDAGQNPWYFRAWNYMWMSHFFIYAVPFFIWPFTYFNVPEINMFYILVNYWVGTLLAGINASIVSVLFLMAMAGFEEVDTNNLKTQSVVLELVLYIFATVGVWFIAKATLVPHAYELL